MLKVGIIGLGVGEAHIEGYLSHPQCKVIALCDFNEEVYTKAKKKYPQYEIYRDSNDILNNPEIDVVSIASWDNYHYEQIIRGIHSNKHLFIEKPICLFEKEAIDIIKLLQLNPKIQISSNLILRKSERFIDLKKRIENNQLGEISYLMGGYNYGRINKITEGWRGKIDFYSIIYGGGIHLIDLMMWLTQQRIVEVSAFGNKIQTNDTSFKFNDMVISNLKFENKIVGSLSANFGCVFPHFHQFEVYGTKSTFINRKEYAEFYQSRDPKDYNRNKILDDTHGNQYVDFEKIETQYKNTPKGKHIYNFIDAIISDKEQEITKKDIFNALSVCFAIEKASQTGKVEKVNYLY